MTTSTAATTAGQHHQRASRSSGGVEGMGGGGRSEGEGPLPTISARWAAGIPSRPLELTTTSRWTHTHTGGEGETRTQLQSIARTELIERQNSPPRQHAHNRTNEHTQPLLPINRRRSLNLSHSQSNGGRQQRHRPPESPLDQQQHNSNDSKIGSRESTNKPMRSFALAHSHFSVSTSFASNCRISQRTMCEVERRLLNNTDR